MTPWLKDAWIKALLSGEYKQGAGWLRSDDERFCCLGVLCDVVDPSRWEKGTVDMRVAYRYKYGAADSYAALPGSMDLMVPHETQVQLVMMNDEENKSFEEIAVWIQENL